MLGEGLLDTNAMQTHTYTQTLLAHVQTYTGMCTEDTQMHTVQAHTCRHAHRYTDMHVLTRRYTDTHLHTHPHAGMHIQCFTRVATPGVPKTNLAGDWTSW